MSTPVAPLPAVPSPPKVRWWKSLHPRELALTFPGPIFQKEVRTAGRKRGTYWIRGLYVAAMFAVITLVFFVVTSEVTERGGSAQMMQATQEVAPAVTYGAVWFQFVALTLVAAIASSSAICDERRAGTLSALLTTPLKAWQIVMGKALGNLVQLAVLLLAAAPVLLAIRVFGGVSARIIGISVVIILLHAMLASMLAIFYSIRAKRAAGAFLVALLSLAFIQGGPPLITFAADELLKEFGSSLFAVFGLSAEPAAWIVVTGSPVALAMTLFMDQMGMPPGIPASIIQNVWLFNAAYLISWIIVIFLLSSWVLRRVLNAEAAGASPAKVAGLPRRSRKKSTTPVPQPLPTPSTDSNPGTATDLAGPQATASTQDPILRTHEFSRDVDDNPVMWRELRQSTFTRPWHLWAAATVCGGMLAFLYYRVKSTEDILHMTIVLICSFVSIAIAAIGTTSGISGERESRAWDALLTTPLTAREIVWGKFLGAVRKQWFTPALLLAHLLIGGVLLGGLNLSFVLLAPTLIGPLLLLGATGVLLSLVCKKSSWAATFNFTLAVGLYLFLPVAFFALGGLSNNYEFGAFLSEAGSGTLIANPIAMAFLITEDATNFSYSYNRGTYDVFDLFTIDFWPFAAMIIGIFLSYLALTGLTLKLASAILASSTGRER